MEVIPLQVFVSLMLVVGSLIAFAVSVHRRDYDHSDRLALFPIDDEPNPTRTPKDPQ